MSIRIGRAGVYRAYSVWIPAFAGRRGTRRWDDGELVDAPANPLLAFMRHEFAGKAVAVCFGKVRGARGGAGVLSSVVPARYDRVRVRAEGLANLIDA